jgi:3'-phosphoadenosine 5'-phosphosulfate sulfotransferase (PAPS reductase)/FAD synthetase
MAYREKIDFSVSPHLSLNSAQVALLSRPERERRVEELIAESGALLNIAEEAARSNGTDGAVLPACKQKLVAAKAGLYSGGNDSTTLVHLFRDRLTHTAHANTGIGLEQTREFVRATSASFGLPLVERASPRFEDSYRALVLDRGFPGPAQHYKMYQRLKERALRVIRNELLSEHSNARVVFIAGRRRDESERRTDVPEMEREGSIVWASPLIQWTKLDMNTYRLMAGDVPVNEVSDILHMSGECLCGSFAKKNELELLAQWFSSDPALALISELEEMIRDRADIPAERRKWGWGAYRQDLGTIMARAKVGRLCAACAV